MTDTRNSGTWAESAAAGEQETWARLRVIIDGLADGIVIVDRDGFIRFVNPAAAQLFARRPEELVGTPLGTPLVAGETTEMEIVRRGGGEILCAELRIVHADWDGEAVELVSLRDVTDRKHAEERSRQLTHEREARLEAEAASRAKSDFLAIMSHELRTPLNAVLGYSELIELGISGELNQVVRDQVARIRISAKHLLGLVNDILDLAKVEAGRFTVANAPANAADAISSALTLIQPQAAAKNLTLDVGANVAQLPTYLGDGERVRQILVNLLSNAVKCTEPSGRIAVDGAIVKSGSVPAHLDRRGNEYLRLNVSDNGSGIPADKIAAIFEPFVQVESGTKRTREGSGLGLTIAKRLAQAMGGDLTVESIVGRGSTFNLWLPIDTSSALRIAATPTGAAAEDVVSFRSVAPVPIQQDLSGMADVAHAVMSGLDALLTTLADRMRTDPALRMAAGVRTSQVADHLATMLANIASALIVVAESGEDSSPLLADGMEIQRLIAERHGAQRARLGWTETSIRREFMLIREELERVVRSAVPADGTLQLTDALRVLNKFVDQAEYIGVRVLEKELDS